MKCCAYSTQTTSHSGFGTPTASFRSPRITTADKPDIWSSCSVDLTNATSQPLAHAERDSTTNTARVSLVAISELSYKSKPIDVSEETPTILIPSQESTVQQPTDAHYKVDIGKSIKLNQSSNIESSNSSRKTKKPIDDIVCSLCGKTFKFLSQLRRHLRKLRCTGGGTGTLDCFVTSCKFHLTVDDAKKDDRLQQVRNAIWVWFDQSQTGFY